MHQLLVLDIYRYQINTCVVTSMERLTTVLGVMDFCPPPSRPQHRPVARYVLLISIPIKLKLDSLRTRRINIYVQR